MKRKHITLSVSEKNDLTLSATFDIKPGSPLELKLYQLKKFEREELLHEFQNQL